MIKRLLLGAVVLIVAAGAFAVYRIGPSNIVGMLRYDQRREGTLRPGDRMPDVELVALDGITRSRLSTKLRDRPLVLVFGSFT